MVGGFTFGFVGDLVVWGCALDLVGLGWLKLSCSDNLVRWEIWLGWAELSRAGNLISFDDLAVPVILLCLNICLDWRLAWIVDLVG